MNSKEDFEVEQSLVADSKPIGESIKTETNIKQLTNENIPRGKCPIRISCKDGKCHSIEVKEQYQSQSHLILEKLTATQDKEISNEIIYRAVSAMPFRKEMDYNFNTAFQSLSDCEPRDSTEAKLCLQSTVLYAQGLRHMEKAENSNRVDHSEFYLKNAIKLLRLHNETIEALAKYRRGGEQKVIVQHVQVNDGGKAIVGNVVNGGGGNNKNDEVIPC
jgi:hypothetical protein